MKVKELLKVLSKDIKVAISYTFGKGYEVGQDYPPFIDEMDVTYVTNSSKDYDLVIHIDQSDYLQKLEEYNDMEDVEYV